MRAKAMVTCDHLGCEIKVGGDMVVIDNCVRCLCVVRVGRGVGVEDLKRGDMHSWERMNALRTLLIHPLALNKTAEQRPNKSIVKGTSLHASSKG